MWGCCSSLSTGSAKGKAEHVCSIDTYRWTHRHTDSHSHSTHRASHADQCWQNEMLFLVPKLMHTAITQWTAPSSSCSLAGQGWSLLVEGVTCIYKHAKWVTPVAGLRHSAWLVVGPRCLHVARCFHLDSRAHEVCDPMPAAGNQIS